MKKKRQEPEDMSATADEIFRDCGLCSNPDGKQLISCNTTYIQRRLAKDA